MPSDDDPKAESGRNDDSAPYAIFIASPMKSHALFQAIGRGVRMKEGIDPNHFVAERSRVHETYIREHEKTRRLSAILSAVLLLAASWVVVFAPDGREGVSHWIGAALLVTSAGAAGYQRIWGRSKRISFGASRCESSEA